MPTEKGPAGSAQARRQRRGCAPFPSFLTQLDSRPNGLKRSILDEDRGTPTRQVLRGGFGQQVIIYFVPH